MADDNTTPVAWPPITEEQFKRWHELSAQATPPPWELRRDGSIIMYVAPSLNMQTFRRDTEVVCSLHNLGNPPGLMEAEGQLLIEMRNHWDELLARLETLQKAYELLGQWYRDQKYELERVKQERDEWRIRAEEAEALLYADPDSRYDLGDDL